VARGGAAAAGVWHGGLSTIDAPAVRAPQVRGAAARVLVVRAPYYQAVVDGLSAGAGGILAQAGARVEVVDVAGAFELAQGVRLAVAGGRGYDGFVALGCVVRGETDHYAFICAASMNGLMQVALDHGLALGTGLLTVDRIEQALLRSGDDGHNKGAEAAAACLRQIDLARAQRVSGDGG
jgi:6,7-dimethyl-8-ribityllumazine synthase